MNEVLKPSNSGIRYKTFIVEQNGLNGQHATNNIGQQPSIIAYAFLQNETL